MLECQGWEWGGLKTEGPIRASRGPRVIRRFDLNGRPGWHRAGALGLVVACLLLSSLPSLSQPSAAGAAATGAIRNTTSSPDPALPAAPSGSISGTVSDSVGGAALAGIAVELIDSTTGSHVASVTARTDATGAYRFSDLLDGTYIVRFNDPDGIYEPQYYDGTSSLEDAAEIEVALGSDIVSIDAHLARRPPGPVRYFRATPGDRAVTLKWTNPATNYVATKILRTTDGSVAAPLPLPGQLAVYEGTRTTFRDTAGLNNGTRYTYTAYVRNPVGMWSLPVTTSAIPTAPPPGPPVTWMYCQVERLVVDYGVPMWVSGGLSDAHGALHGRTEVVVMSSTDGGLSWVEGAHATECTYAPLYESSVVLTRNTRLCMRFKGAPGYQETTSNVCSVLCRASLTRPRLPSVVRVNRRFTVRGELRPKHTGGTRVELWRRVNHRWVYAASFPVLWATAGLSYARYAARVVVSRRGVWVVSVRHADFDHFSGSAWSAPFRCR